MFLESTEYNEQSTTALRIDFKDLKDFRDPITSLIRMGSSLLTPHSSLF